MFKILSLVLLGFGVAAGPVARAAEVGAVTRTEDVIYGRKFGTALTLDVFAPARPNGAAVLYVVSSGWVSAREGINPKRYQPLLDRGYTVFAVLHGSQPRYTIPEMLDDVQRAVRFVRHHAARWGVDPERLALSGGSAGGHLALLAGVRSAAGRTEAPDPVDRQSSAVQAVACLYPPSDFLNWSRPGEVRPVPADARPAFGPAWATPEGQQAFGREYSPAHHLTAAAPPILVFHGDADQRVPVFQSRRLEEKARSVGAVFRLVVVPGAGHAAEFGATAEAMTAFADWFDSRLKPRTP